MNKILILATIATSLLLTACSSTSGVPEGDQLYTGLTKIKYETDKKDDHYLATQEELEAALAAAPNGALLGSSYYRSPIQLRLWIWNTFSSDSTLFGRWMTRSFGRAPILMSRVNPALRASVAQSILRNHGYFRGTVDYEIVSRSNPKEGKIGYTAHFGPLFTIDTLRYVNFPGRTQALLDSTSHLAAIRPGSPFAVAGLDAERQRIARLFRDNGYYYYQPGYASYMADTISKPLQANVRLLLADNMPEQAKRQWHIGKLTLELKKNFFEQPTDTFRRRRFSVLFSGKKSPIRTRVIMADVKLRPGQLYNYTLHQESMNKLNGMGLFSSVDFRFTPRDSTNWQPSGKTSLHAGSPQTQGDSLDLTISCVFDKKYDFYIESNVTGKTSGRMGPGIVVGLTKRNAFRGGEKLDVRLNGAYEWQMGHSQSGASSRLNSYEYGIQASIEYPRILFPFRLRHRFYTIPSTLLTASSSVINRAGYFKRHIVSGELTYHFQTSATSLHQFSPINLVYNYMTSRTAEFDDVIKDNPYLKVTMADVFIPKMKYTYIYNSPQKDRHPLMVQLGVSEAGNILSLGYLAAGKKWGEKDKTLFKNAYAQFFKVEASLRKSWQIDEHSQLVAHLETGAIWSFGNSISAPYNEQFYVGGANSIRAFNIRSVGPGAFAPTSTTNSYLDQTGDVKLLANVEYRPRIFGNLYGAIFLDAGNVWALRDTEARPGGAFSFRKVPEQLAFGTGIGLRYDLEFFVVRIDWGIGLHLPYKPGFYNVGKFKNSQTLNFAIGYPF